MDTLVGHTTEEEVETPSHVETIGASLMTPLGLVEGEALTYLEGHCAVPLRKLTRELAWPSTMVLMAVGALIREGLVRATQHGLEVLIEPSSAAHRFKSVSGT